MFIKNLLIGKLEAFNVLVEMEKWTAYYTEVSRQKNKVMEILGFKGKAEALEEIKKSLIN